MKRKEVNDSIAKLKKAEEIMREAEKIWENIPSRFEKKEIKAIGYCLVRIAIKYINKERLKRIRKGDEMHVEEI